MPGDSLRDLATRMTFADVRGMSVPGMHLCFRARISSSPATPLTKRSGNFLSKRRAFLLFTKGKPAAADRSGPGSGYESWASNSFATASGVKSIRVTCGL